MGKIKGAIIVDEERCKGCNLCVVACPLQILSLADTKGNTNGYDFVRHLNEDTCNGCASCAIVCPDGCITVYKKKL